MIPPEFGDITNYAIGIVLNYSHFSLD